MLGGGLGKETRYAIFENEVGWVWVFTILSVLHALQASNLGIIEHAEGLPSRCTDGS